MGKHSSSPAQDHPAPGFSRNPWRVALLFALAVAIGAALICAVWLRPLADPGEHTSTEFAETYALNQPQVEGEVSSVDGAMCQSEQTGRAFDTPPLIPADPGGVCTRALVGITSGPNAGRMTQLVFFGVAGDPKLEPGDKIVLSESKAADGAMHYSFADYQRGGTLLTWAVIAAIVVLAFAAWHGLRSLIGLAISLGIVFFYLMPALVEGHNPVLLALASCTIMISIAVPLVHGLNWKSASALAGSLAALLLAAVLSHLMIDSSNLQGFSSEDNLKLQLYMPEVSIVGVLLCGFVVGALGGLNDVSIAQASTVMELSNLDPLARPVKLFTSAMKVGRDHIASIVYTLVLTYTGASVPLMMLITAAQRPAGQILSSDLIATELLRSAVGIIILTLSVPITTFIAAFTIPERKAAIEIEAAPQ